MTLIDGLVNLLYSKPSDLVTSLATVALKTGTPNTVYPISRLTDGDPATHFKTLNTDDVRVTFHFSGAQRLDGVWIPMYNWPAGTVVKFEGNTADSWPGTFSVSVTVPEFLGDMPRGLFINLFDAVGYSATGFEWWSLLAVNPGQVTSIGEVYLSQNVQGARHLENDVSENRARTVAVNQREDGNTFRDDRGTDQLVFEGSVSVPWAEMKVLRSLWGSVHGEFTPFPIVFEVYEDQPEGVIVRWVSPWRSTWDPSETKFKIDLVFDMVIRGRMP